MCVHFKIEVIFFHSFLSCRSPVPTATSFLPTQRLQLGRAGPGLSQLPLWCLPAKHSSGVSPGCEVRKRLHGLVFSFPGQVSRPRFGPAHSPAGRPGLALQLRRLRCLKPPGSLDTGLGAFFKILPRSVFNQVRSSVTKFSLFSCTVCPRQSYPTPDLSRYPVENLD